MRPVNGKEKRHAGSRPPARRRRGRPAPLPGLVHGEAVYADHGYHHTGTQIEVPTSYKFLGTADGPQTIVRAVLKSWTHPLDAEPGPALIELNLGTAAERTDMCAEITPAEARAVARALLDLAATAERPGPAGNSADAGGL